MHNLEHSNWDDAGLESWLEYEEVVSALAQCLHISTDDLTEALREGSYRTFQLPKRSGGARTINAPSDNLKCVQRAALDWLYNYPVSDAATGCVPGRSIKDNAHPHRHSEVFLKMDIENAFPSVTGEMIHRLLTQLMPEDFSELNPHEQQVLVNLATSLVIHGQSLPQGTPTSPYLFNLVFSEIDAQIQEVLTYSGLVEPEYTRYLDDLTMSGKGFQEIFDLYELLEEVFEQLYDLLANQSQFSEVHRQLLSRNLPDPIRMHLEALTPDNLSQTIGWFDKNIQKIVDALEMQKIYALQAEVASLCRSAGFQIHEDKTEISVDGSANITGMQVLDGRLQVSQSSIDRHTARLEKIYVMLEALYQGNYDPILSDENVSPELYSAAAEENDELIAALLFTQVHSSASFILHCRNAMGRATRPLIKAYNTLRARFPEIIPGAAPQEQKTDIQVSILQFRALTPPPEPKSDEDYEEAA